MHKNEIKEIGGTRSHTVYIWSVPFKMKIVILTFMKKSVTSTVHSTCSCAHSCFIYLFVDSEFLFMCMIFGSQTIVYWEDDMNTLTFDERLEHVSEQHQHSHHPGIMSHTIHR